MDLKTLSLYFRDINKFPVLSEEEERKLIRGVQNNDEEAIKKLITCNLRFVVSVARHYRGRGLSFTELINEGNIGLLKAAKRYNLDNKVKFISYAVWWIRQSIQKALFDQAGMVRIPPNKIALLAKFKKALEQNKGDYRKTLEMKEFKVHAQEILDMMDKIKGTSLDAPINMNKSADEESSKTLNDVLGQAPNQDIESERQELSKVIDSVLQNISSREEKILRMYYGLNFPKQFTLEEISKELNLTRERVRLIRDRSLKKLFRNPALRNKLSMFMRNE
jgi:RNA polymerase primary sigma factor